VVSRWREGVVERRRWRVRTGLGVRDVRFIAGILMGEPYSHNCFIEDIVYVLGV
jgi:hypothetical protein